MLNRVSSLVLILSLGFGSAAAVEYDGEKTLLKEIKYEMCIIPPQVQDAAKNGIQVINVDKAKKLFEQKARFYDAREMRHYRHQHIKGAYPVHFDVSKAQYMVIDLPRDKEEPLLFYCYGESCASSYEAAMAVRKLGHKKVYWMLNGFHEWRMKGYPVESVK